MQEAAIVFEDVWKSYPSYYHVCSGIKGFLFNIFKAINELRSRRSALEGLSFTVYKGENFGIIGHNGAGKSTTLGLIAGVLTPNKGHIQVNDRVSPLLELGTGFHPELSGRANILLNGVLLGLTREEVLAHEQEIIDFAELGDFIDMPVRTYSSGMYAKLGFAIVATLKPQILLLDEILSVGDIAFQHKCKKVFDKFRYDPEVTTVLVSHNLAQMRAFCDRIAWIENKTLKMIGPAAEVIKAYEKENLISSPMNTLEKTPPVLWVNATILDCSSGPASFSTMLFPFAQEKTLHIQLFQNAKSAPIEWQTSNVNLTLSQQNALWTLTSNGVAVPPLPRAGNSAQQEVTPASPNVPLALCITSVDASGAITPPAWLAVCPTPESRKELAEASAKVLAERAPEPLLPPFLLQQGGTIRIVARTIAPHDDNSNLALAIAGVLKELSLPASVYAYATSSELAGMVKPIANLHTELDAADIIFYLYSDGDAFLPHIASLYCAKKILYYHTVRPAPCGEEPSAEAATHLHHSRDQFPLFAQFSAVLADSKHSMDDITPYIPKQTPCAVFSPSMSAHPLTRTLQEPVLLPEAQCTNIMDRTSGTPHAPIHCA